MRRHLRGCPVWWLITWAGHHPLVWWGSRCDSIQICTWRRRTSYLVLDQLLSERDSLWLTLDGEVSPLGVVAWWICLVLGDLATRLILYRDYMFSSFSDNSTCLTCRNWVVDSLLWSAMWWSGRHLVLHLHWHTPVGETWCWRSLVPSHGRRSILWRSHQRRWCWTILWDVLYRIHPCHFLTTDRHYDLLSSENSFQCPGHVTSTDGGIRFLWLKLDPRRRLPL